jgi:hypothetical protein
MVAEELVELLALLVPLAAGDAAALALGVAVFPVSACPAVI